MPNVLLVEDEDVIRTALRRLLERNGYGVSEAGSVQEASDQFDLDGFDAIISDLRLPGLPGTELIKRTPTPVLIMTSYASLRSAIDSMKVGAVDYIAKPFEHEELLSTLERVLGSELKQQNRSRRNPRPSEEPVPGMVGSCPAMQELFRRIRKVAQTTSSVLIQGESGTGKELVARALHEASSRRAANLISVNCAAIPENLIESELFGHEKGAFTGATNARTGLIEAADNGTLFLDEIGELPLEAQARLLRVLQEHEIRKVGSVQSQRVDVRLQERCELFRVAWPRLVCVAVDAVEEVGEARHRQRSARRTAAAMRSASSSARCGPIGRLSTSRAQSSASGSGGHAVPAYARWRWQAVG